VTLLVFFWTNFCENRIAQDARADFCIFSARNLSDNCLVIRQPALTLKRRTRTIAVNFTRAVESRAQKQKPAGFHRRAVFFRAICA
jgi:hypothetical protein